MSLFFIYSLKVALCLAAFYLLYKLLLSRDTFFGFNRAAILGMDALSLLLPLAHVSAGVDAGGIGSFAVVEGVVAETVGGGAQVGVLTPVSACFAVYVLGVAFFAGREAWSLLSLRRLLRGGRVVGRYGGAKVVVVKGDVPPFSWMGNIVISEKDYADHPECILMHELAHVSARHSWDILLADLLIVLQWFNPSAWLFKVELQGVHEYEADRRVLSSGVSAPDYQLLLIRKAVGERLFSMANNLNQCSLKKRITMMEKRNSNPWSRLKVLAALPVAAFAVAAFATPKAESLSSEIKAESEALVAKVTESAKADTLKGKPVGVLVSKIDGKDVPAIVEDPDDGGATPMADGGSDGKVYDVVEEMPQYPGGIEAMMTFLRDNLKYPAELAEQNIQGRVIVQFVVDKEGNVTNPTVMRSVDPQLDAEALRVVKAMPKWTPGKVGGKAVNVKYTLPVTFALSAKNDKKDGLTKAYYLIDGKHVDDISNIKPQDIESIEVFKDKKNTVDKYGDAAKHGVISVKLKKKN